MVTENKPSAPASSGARQATDAFIGALPNPGYSASRSGELMSGSGVINLGNTTGHIGFSAYVGNLIKNVGAMSNEHVAKMREPRGEAATPGAMVMASLENKIAPESSGGGKAKPKQDSFPAPSPFGRG